MREKNLAAFMEGSHAVNEEGRPLVLYHGTADDFDEFRHFQANKKDKGWLGRGFYFTNSRPLARSYSLLKAGKEEPRVMEVHLSLKNPFYATKEHREALRWALEQNPHAADDFRNQLLDAGHDGVIFDHGGPDQVKEYVALHPEQIKSATDNNGDFDPSNPNITKAQGGEVEDNGITAYHATWEPFTQYDWSKLGSVTAENSTGGDWASNLAGIGPWAHERDLAKSVGAPVTLPVNITGEPLHFRSLDELERTVSEHGGPEEFRDRMLRQGFGHIVVNDEEFGGKSFVALAPEHFKVKTQNHRLDPKQQRMDKASGGEVDDDGIAAYHGSPHDYPAERLIRSPEGQEQYIVGQPGRLPEVPQGATVMQDFPLGRMRMDKIGTGEGAQAYGHGLYTAEAERIAKHYRDALTAGAENMTIDGGKFSDHYRSADPEKSLKAQIALSMLIGKRGIQDAIDWEIQQTIGKLSSRRLLPEDAPALQEDLLRLRQFKKEPPDIQKNAGRMYEVRINAHPDHFLDWDKPIQEQPYVMQKLVESGALKPDGELSFMYNESPRRGGEMYERLTSPMASHLTGGKSQQHASDFLRGIGIKGIRYLDAGSRGAGEGSRNYVVFDDKLIDVKRKYADGGVVKESSDGKEAREDRSEARKGRAAGGSPGPGGNSGARVARSASRLSIGDRSPIVERALMVVSRKA
jgi:hypothetical protein